MSSRSNTLSNEQISKINRDVIIPALDFNTALDYLLMIVPLEIYVTTPFNITEMN